MKKINLFFAAIFIAALVSSQTVATFDNLPLAPDTFWNGSDGSGGFSSGEGFFINSYDTAYGGTWSGFAYSDKTDTITPGYVNQYSAVTGSGFGGSANYAVAYVGGTTQINLTGNGAGKVVEGFYVTNSTYDYRSMLNGDAYSKKFGGPDGTDPDWFKLTVTGWYNGVALTDSVNFYLADYRFMDSTENYIVENWRWVDLRPLGNMDSLQFFLSSTDNGPYGMNTPAYFDMDNFTTSDRLAIKPVANDEYVTIDYLQDTLINVSAYDFDPSGDPLAINLIAGPFVQDANAYDTANGIMYQPAISIAAVDYLIYTVCDTLTSVCDTGIVFVTINGLPSGISEIALQGISAMPNPFTGSLYIQHPANVEKIMLYDMQGRELREIICDGYTGKTPVNGEGLPAGAYVARLISANSSTVIQLIKQ